MVKESEFMLKKNSSWRDQIEETTWANIKVPRGTSLKKYTYTGFEDKFMGVIKKVPRGTFENSVEGIAIKWEL